jgi:hypothetical protein
MISSIGLRKSELLIYLAVFIFGLAIRILGSMTESLHIDELVMAQYLNSNLEEVFRGSAWAGQPPTDLLIQWLVIKTFGFSSLNLKLWPILANLLSIIVFFFATRNFLKKESHLIFFYLLVVYPFSLWQSNYSRPYSIYILVISLWVLFFCSKKVNVNNWMIVTSLLFITFFSRNIEGPLSAVMFLLALFYKLVFTAHSVKFKFLLAFFYSMVIIICFQIELKYISLFPNNALNFGPSISQAIFAFDYAKMLKTILVDFVDLLIHPYLLFLWILISTLIFLLLAMNGYGNLYRKFITSNISFLKIFSLISLISIVNVLTFYFIIPFKYYDRYFSLTLVVHFFLILFLLVLPNFLTQRTFYVYCVNLFLIAIITFSISFQKALTNDNFPFDTINEKIQSDLLRDDILAVLPGPDNQYIPGWPLTLGSDSNKFEPNWIQQVSVSPNFRVGIDEVVLYNDKRMSTLLVFPFPDERENFLMGRVIPSDYFKDSKYTFSNNTYFFSFSDSKELMVILKSLRKSLEIDQRLWIQLLIDRIEFDQSITLNSRFCYGNGDYLQVDLGNSLGIWGAGVKNLQDFYKELNLNNSDFNC